MKITHGQSGFSVFELFLSIGITSIVGLTVSQNIVDSKKQEIQSQQKLDFELIQLASTQKSRSYTFWRDVIEDLPNKVNVENCLAGFGTNCNLLNSSNWVKAYENCLGQSCEFKSEISYKLICTLPQSCLGIETQTQSTFLPASSAKEKTLPSVDLTSPLAGGSLRSELTKIKTFKTFINGQLITSTISEGVQNNLCAASEIVTEMNSNHSTLHCNANSGSQRCSSQLHPLRQFGSTTSNDQSSIDCQTPAQKNCATEGLSSIGAFNSSSGPGGSGSGSSGSQDQVDCDRAPATDSSETVPEGNTRIVADPTGGGTSDPTNPTSNPTTPVVTPPPTEPTPAPTKLGGVCGKANGGTYDNFPSSELCSRGTLQATDYLANDGTYNWNCIGSGGGDNISCSANKTPDSSYEL